MRKRERTREQAAELRQMQKLFLLKAMANPGQPVVHIALIAIEITIRAPHHMAFDHNGDRGCDQDKPAKLSLLSETKSRNGDNVFFSQVAEQPDLDGSGAKAGSRMRQANIIKILILDNNIFMYYIGRPIHANNV